MSDLSELAQRYIAVWNEPDAERRLAGIEALWAVDCAHYTDIREAHGYDALHERIAKAYEQWVAPGQYVFRAVDNANGHHNTVRFNWEMVTTDSDQVVSVGFDFLLLDDQGKISVDYQFID
ncbi:MAG TPA: nuclear transport factor 2 family protein [Pseudonocardiaceae bacterium]|nr:nuclear transport factor 2 family protein [Pseudonocardiaceae bacterium]